MSREIAYCEQIKCVAETDKAICVVQGGPGVEDGVWIPKSQIHSDSEVTEKGDRGTLALPAWLADEKGLDY